MTATSIARTRFWITRTSREAFMLTALPPTIATVEGSSRKKAFVTYGDPVGIKNLCALGVHAIAPAATQMEILESRQVDISVALVNPLNQQPQARKDG